MNQKNTNGIKIGIIVLCILIPILIGMVVTVLIVVSLFSKESYRLIKVNSFEGDSTVQRVEEDQTAEYPVFKGLQLVSEDTVSVGNDSFLELLADKDKHIGAYANTKFVLHTTGNEKSGNITIELLSGEALFTIDKKLKEGSSFEVTTPNATLSVRGTCFDVAYNPKTGVTDIIVYEGKVWVSSAEGERILEKDEVLSISGNVSDGDSSGSGEEAVPVEESATETALFFIDLNYPHQTDLAPASLESVNILVHPEQYKESQTEASYYFDSEFPEDASLLNSFVYEFDQKYIEPRKSDINQYYLENRDTHLTEGNSELLLTDATSWFPETIELPGEERTYTCHISRVELRICPHFMDKESIKDPSTLPPSYFEHEGYIGYIGALRFWFYGTME